MLCLLIEYETTSFHFGYVRYHFVMKAGISFQANIYILNLQLIFTPFLNTYVLCISLVTRNTNREQGWFNLMQLTIPDLISI